MLKNLIISIILILSSVQIFSLNIETSKIAEESINKFALDMYKTLAEEEGNIVFSPYSISSAMTMTSLGARGNTEKEFADVLYFGKDKKTQHYAFSILDKSFDYLNKSTELKLLNSNSLWIDKKLKLNRSFKKSCKLFYQAGLKTVNFQKKPDKSRLRINKWVEKKTEGKITDLLSEIDVDSSTRLVLANAIYFNGKWAKQFNADKTKDGDFFYNSRTPIKLPFMYQKNTFRYGEFKDLKILEMDYSGENLSMIIILPERKQGLKNLEQNLSSELLTTIRENLYEQPIKVYLPKFEASDRFSLKSNFKKLGLREAFTGNADFSGINNSRDLHISDVIHKAFISVGEEGTEASAATAVVMRKGFVSEEPQVKEFRANHPFIYLIQDKSSKTILFMGRVVNPKN